MKYKILVTGGAGFVGSNLIKTLVSSGYEVSSIDNYSTGLKSNHVEKTEYIDADLAILQDYSFLGKINFIFHLAATARIQPSFKEPLKYFKNNCVSTFNISKYASENNIPIVYAGSSSHHGGRFSNPYTFTKDLGEDIIQLFQSCFHLKASIARFYNVYGPNELTEGSYTTLIGKWKYNYLHNLPLVVYGDGTKRRDFTHVQDIVDALVLIMKNNSFGHVFELGRGKNRSVNDILKLFKYDNIKYEQDRPGEVKITLCDNSLALKELGWSPNRDVEDYIEEILRSKNK